MLIAACNPSPCPIHVRQALREDIAMKRVQNDEIAQTARWEAEMFRAQLKQALQERDQAHDHLLLLKQKWLEGCGKL